MATTPFALAIRTVKSTVRAKWKRQFLTDLLGQIEEDEDVDDIVNRSRGKTERLAVTFDRKINDVGFSYVHFDMLLTALDHAHGGSGIRKPCNQVRTLLWRGGRPQLLATLRHFASLNRALKFRRLLILPCPDPVIGWRTDPSIHMQLTDA